MLTSLIDPIDGNEVHARESVNNIAGDKKEEQNEVDGVRNLLCFRRNANVNGHVDVKEEGLNVVGDEENRPENNRQGIGRIGLDKDDVFKIGSEIKDSENEENKESVLIPPSFFLEKDIQSVDGKDQYANKTHSQVEDTFGIH